MPNILKSGSLYRPVHYAGAARAINFTSGPLVEHNRDIPGLLIIEESRTDAEALANELKTAGHQFQFRHAADLGEVEAVLDSQHPDMIVAGSGGKLPDHAALMCSLHRAGCSVPVIAIADSAPEEAVVDALRSGVTALVSYDQPRHLHLRFSLEMDGIHARRALDAARSTLRKSEIRCQKLIMNSSDAIAYIHDGMHVYANRPYLDLFSISEPQAVEGIPLLDMISREQRDTFRHFIRNYSEHDDRENTLAIDCVSAQGEAFSTSMEISHATMDGEPCLQIIIRVTESNQELERKIRTLSQKDMLTGIANRQHFMQSLTRELGNRDAGKRALYYITLDNFKSLREDIGIAASDQVLRNIAALIEQACADGDLPARFGDFSFVLLHHGDREDGIQAHAEQLRKDIEEHLVQTDSHAVTLTASIGVCIISQYATDPQKLISHGDMACEVARTAGGNRIHTHSNVIDDDENARNEIEWDRFVRETIEQERFHLVYQPIVSLKGELQEHYEVLLRVVDENEQTLRPGQFISIAATTGLAGQLDRWVIDHALATLAKQAAERDVSFFIKLTDPSINDAELPGWIESRLAGYGLAGRHVVFQIPENAIIARLQESTAFIDALHALGCAVAIEHYGVKNQPQLFRHVSAEFLKIDRSLISALTSDSEVRERVQALISLAAENDRLCIAECVDDAGTLAVLWQYGVDYIQGNFVQEPSLDLSYVFESELV